VLYRLHIIDSYYYTGGVYRNIFSRNVQSAFRTARIGRAFVIEENTFYDNICSSTHNLVLLSSSVNVNADYIVRNNNFTNNRCYHIIALQLTANAIVSGYEISGNIFMDNTPLNPTLPAVVAITGYNTAFYHNFFENPNAQYDLALLKSPLSTSTIEYFNATNNWWGEDDEVHVRMKIYDFLENPTILVAIYHPWLMNGNSTVVTNQSISLEPLRGNELGGYLLEDAAINGGQYVLEEGLVVMAGFTLEIGAGTTFLFKKGMSLVILGTLIVNGTEENPVIFTSNEPNPT
jgi:hypothetical protein